MAKSTKRSRKKAKPAKQAAKKRRIVKKSHVKTAKTAPAKPAQRLPPSRVRPRRRPPAPLPPRPRSSSAYDQLPRTGANFQPLTPLSMLERAASVFPDHPAVIHGKQRFTYTEFYKRSRRLASALAAHGIGKNDTVAAMLANTPAMLEAHYGVPMTGGVLNGLNTRLDAAALAFILDYCETKV